MSVCSTTTPRRADRRAPLARRLLALSAACLLLPAAGFAQTFSRISDPTPYCGDEGVWIQILGGGGPELNDDEASASYLVFHNNKARVLVDAAPGSSYLFDRAGGRINDLDVIALTNLQAERTSDLPAFVTGGRHADRDRPLPLLGPDGREGYPDTETLLARMIGPEGAWPSLADHLTGRGVGGFRVSPRNVPAIGQRRWSGFGNEYLKLSAIPISHGTIPALAWRVEIDGMKIVFTGDFNSQIGLIADFAKDADALVIHHSVPEGTRGTLAEQHVSPGQIGQIAAQAGVRMVILGHRMNRTRGRETLSTTAIEEHYNGPLIFANDLECWGL